MTDIGVSLTQIVKRLERIERAARLGYASLDDTALEVRDATGSLRGIVGQQGDGTTAVNIVNGGPPPAPSTPTVTPALGGVGAGWDGQFADGAIIPLDWSRVEVHASPTAGFTPTAETLMATIETAQGGIAYIPTTVPLYVTLLARNTSGTASPASAEVGPYAPKPVAGEIGIGEITEIMIGDGAVTTPKVFANAITTALLAAGAVDATALKADAITGKTITGGTMTGATVQTASSGARVVLDTAMRLYNPSGELLAEAVPNASALGYPNDAGFIVYNTVGVGRYWAQLSRGFIRFGKDGANYRWAPLIDYFISGSDNSVLEIQSGAIESGGEEENQATISLVGTSGATTGDHPHVDIGGSGLRDSGRADLNITGVLAAGNIAYGTIIVTTTAANSPASAAVTGLNVAGTSFRAYVTASSGVPGTQMLGAAATNVTANGMTVTVTRTNTTSISTSVYWLLIGA